jgi:hypothetical protein
MKVQNHIKKARTKKITEEIPIKKINNNEMIRFIILDCLVERRPPTFSKSRDFERNGRHEAENRLK